MSGYSERHPSLVDKTTTEAILNSLPPPGSPSESAKRNRSAAGETPLAQAKKPK